MANDLKPMLSKVLASGGQKKFFFAYGAGKRKDGKGDGEIAVHGQKPKKADIENELTDCKQVLEGVCWTGKGPDDGETVYFQGKSTKLSTALVSKMALTAKRVVGRQYDFQIPTPEEEERAASLKEGDGDEATAPVPQAPVNGQSATKEDTSPLQIATYKRVLADLKPRFDKARVLNSDLMPQMGHILSLAKANRYADAVEMLDKLEIEVDRTLAAAPKPAITGAEFKARLKALVPNYNVAIKEDPALLAQLRPLMGQVIAQSNANQFEQAWPILIQIEKALADAKSKAKADPAATPPSGMQRFNGLMPGIKAALGAGGPNVARIQTLVGAVSGLLKNNDPVQANKILDELEPLLKPGTGAGAADSGGDWKAKLAEWSPGIKAAMTAKGPNAAAIAKLLAQATVLSKPGGDMAQALAKLTECHELATGSAAAPNDSGEQAKAQTYKDKLAEWSPGIKAAMTAKGPNAAAIAKLLAQATALAKPGGDIVQALAKLTECHALATGAAAPAQAAEAAQPEGAAKPASDEKKEDAKGDFDYAKARVEWLAARSQAQAELKKLKTAILEKFADQPELTEITQKIDILDAVLEEEHGGLADVLGEAAKANETALPNLHDEAARLIRQQLADLKANALLKEIDVNPFAEVRIRKVLTGVLKKLAREIGS